MSKKRFRLIIVVITIAAFLSTSVAAGPAPASQAPEAFDISALSLPAGLGEVNSVFKGTNGKTILHIQDAHCNYNAQHSIADIISNLSGLYNADLVFLEGGRGSYNFSAFDHIKAPSIREKVSDYFVREGIVNGPEYFAINNPGRTELYGIEDEDLYFKNLKVYRDSLAFKKEADLYLKTLSRAMNNIKLKAYPPALKELDEKMAAHREYKISFKAYAAYLKEKAEANDIAIAPYKNLSALFTTIKTEKTINFKEAEKERSLLIDKVEANLPKTEIKELENRAALYRTGALPSEAFYDYLFKEAKIANADFKALPNLVKYSEYLKAYESIDKSALLKEIKDVEGLVADKLSKTEDQRKIWRLDNDLNILKAIFSTSLIKEDFNYYNAHKDDFDVKNFTTFFVKRGPVYGLKFTPDEKLNLLDTYRNEMEKFYAYSLQRDDAFLKNIEAKLKSSKKNIAVLVTGGFHSANLFKLFKDKGYSYAKIMPKFKADQADNPYFNLLAGGMTPMQEFLKTAVNYTPEKATLAIETPFSQMPIPFLVQNIIGLEIDMLSRLMAKKDFTIQTAAGFIVTSQNPIENEKALERFSIESNGIVFNAAFVSGPLENHVVDAVLLDNESMRWERGKGIIEGAPGQGPQAAGEKKAVIVPRYSQVVSVIRGVVGVGVGPQYADERLIGKDETEKEVGAAGVPFRVALKTTVTPEGRAYIEVPQPEGGIPEWGADMIKFDRAVLESQKSRPLVPQREYRIYVEHPQRKGELRTLEETLEVNGLTDVIRNRQIGNIKIKLFTPEEHPDIFQEIASAPENVSVATFVFKPKIEENAAEKDLRDRMEKRSYAVYMGLKSDDNYVPVRTCGMTALKIFDYENIVKRRTPATIADQNQAVELIARGIGLLCGASAADIIGLISTIDETGRRELLRSGLVFVAIRPYDIKQIDELNRMARKVREAV